MPDKNWWYSECEVRYQKARQLGLTRHEAIRAVVDYCIYMMSNIEAERDRLVEELKKPSDAQNDMPG